MISREAAGKVQAMSETFNEIAELEALEFEAMELHPAAEFWADCVALREDAGAAIGVMGKSKAELIGAVANDHEGLGPLLMRFSKAAELARSLAELLEAAETRMGRRPGHRRR
jgi:hypothetical protein